MAGLSLFPVPLRASAGVAAALAYRESGDPFAAAGPRRSLRIGICSSLSRGFLRELVRAAMAAPEAPVLSFLEGGPHDVLQATQRGEVDVAVVYGDHDFGRLQHETLWSERLVVALPEGHALFRENAVQADQVLREPILAQGDPSDGDALLGFLEHALGGPPDEVLCLPVDRETLFNLVGLGFGLALATGSALGTFYPGVVYRTLSPPHDCAPFHLVWRDGTGCEELGPFLATARALAGRWASDRASAWDAVRP